MDTKDALIDSMREALRSKDATTNEQSLRQQNESLMAAQIVQLEFLSPLSKSREMELWLWQWKLDGRADRWWRRRVAILIGQAIVGCRSLYWALSVG